MYTYFPGATRITEGMAPDMKNTSYTITGTITVPDSGAEGMIVTQGGWLEVMRSTCSMANQFRLRAFALPRAQIQNRSARSAACRTARLRVDFAYDGGDPGSGGTATIFVDNAQVGSGRIDQTVPVRVSADETFDVGEDSGTPVNRDYDVPFHFTGELHNVVVELKPSDS